MRELPPNSGTPYIPESTIRYLIDGGRGTRGWRCDDEFYEEYVSPTFPERSAWDSWTEGKWREYWFAFWAAVRDFYNAQAEQELHDENARLWDPDSQTNLTKSVSLRLFQALFIEAAIDRVERVQSTRQMVAEVLGDVELADKKIAEKVGSVAIPDTVERFREDVTLWFLEKGVPARFFLKGWKASLDDAQGQADLRDEMRKAFQYGQEGRRYHTRNVSVFAVGEDNQGAES